MSDVLDGHFHSQILCCWAAIFLHHKFGKVHSLHLLSLLLAVQYQEQQLMQHDHMHTSPVQSSEPAFSLSCRRSFDGLKPP